VSSDWRRHFDENRSVWLAGKEPYHPCPPLAADRSADVVILGGGFTGMATAYHLSRRFPEKGMVLLEAREIGNGASGRNGGQMLNWVNGFDPSTPEEAKRIYDATREGIESILGIVAEHRLPVPLTNAGHYEIFTTPRAADAGQELLAQLQGSGVPLRFVCGRDLGAAIDLEGVEGAIFDPGSGTLDGLAYLRSLRPVLEKQGVSIFEGTPAVRLREGRTLEVETPGGSVRAAAAVLATNAYTRELGYFRSALIPLHSHVIATGPRPPEEWASRGWKKGASFIDDRSRISYGTLTPDGRVLFGGGSNSAYQYLFGNRTHSPGPSDASVESMRRQLLRYLPRLEGVPITHRWSGPVALTLSRLPAIGVRGAHRNLYFALGYSGHGITLANLAGKILSDLYAGSEERWQGLPFYERKPRFIPPEPLRFLGYQGYTRLTGRSPRIRERAERTDRTVSLR
jgi:glycine/D-amino acid oxidase-like deaminating enzyme